MAVPVATTQVGFPGEKDPGRYAGEVEAYLKSQNLTMLGAPRPKTGHIYDRATLAEAVRQANGLEYSGWQKILFIKERMNGMVSAGDTAQSTGPILAGILGQLDVQKETHKTNPTTHVTENGQTKTVTEDTESAISKGVPSIAGEIAKLIGAYGLRLGEILAGAALILFGLVTIAKGSAPSPTKLAAAAIV